MVRDFAYAGRMLQSCLCHHRGGHDCAGISASTAVFTRDEQREKNAFHSDSRFMEFNSSIWCFSLSAPRLFNLQMA